MTLSSTADVLVKVVNRAMPVFDVHHYKIDVLESAPIGATVRHIPHLAHTFGVQILQVNAMSNVGGTVGYTIFAGNDDAHFDIEYITGRVFRTCIQY